MKSKIIVTFVLALAIMGAVKMNINSQTKNLKMAYSLPWINIHPGLQHTLAGDLALSNQFEALVGFNDNGVYIPLAAKEWTMAPDFKKVTFKIDTSKEFSDGVRLSAKHFKESWISALKLDPKSANSSLLDVFYKIEGFSEFQKTGDVSGVKVINDETLEINFSTPFRMALEHLGGNRFSVFREENAKFIGTGAFLISEVEKDHLKLTPNKNFPIQANAEIDLKVVLARDAVQSLVDGNIDVMAYALGAKISPEWSKHKNLSILVGQDAIHLALYPNAQNGRLFSNKTFRQALQFLANKYYSKNPNELGNADFTTIDPQVYLPYQGGRLDERLVTERITQAEKYVKELQEATRKNPIVVYETEEFSIRAFLEFAGLSISEKSKILNKAEAIKAIYSGKEADLIPGGFGVASGDPDGIYHLLGNNGAIATPMLRNETVSSILEEGRKLVNSKEIDPFYKKVSLTILDEAPFVHLGFNKAVAIYRNDKVSVNSRILRRNEGHLYIFEAK